MNDSAAPAIVTAGILVIGDEILSGRTKDKNIGYIAEYLTTIGIDLDSAVVSPSETDWQSELQFPTACFLANRFQRTLP